MTIDPKNIEHIAKVRSFKKAVVFENHEKNTYVKDYNELFIL